MEHTKVRELIDRLPIDSETYDAAYDLLALPYDVFRAVLESLISEEITLRDLRPTIAWARSRPHASDVATPVKVEPRSIMDNVASKLAGEGIDDVIVEDRLAMEISRVATRDAYNAANPTNPITDADLAAIPAPPVESVLSSVFGSTQVDSPSKEEFKKAQLEAFDALMTASLSKT